MTLSPPITVRHEWVPNPKQATVLETIASAPAGSTSMIGFGGAAGGAKTNLIANLAFWIGTLCPGSEQLITRQDFVDLKTTTLAEFDEQLPPGIEVKRYDSAPVYRDFRLSPDVPFSRVWFRPCEDWKSLLSNEYYWVHMDEAQEIPMGSILGLLTRLRQKPAIEENRMKWGVTVCFNPFPGWAVEWLMRGNLPKELSDLNVRFIQSLVDDNPHLREGYKQLLAANPDPVMRAIMLDGNPDAGLESVLYFPLESIRTGESHCTDPEWTLETRLSPDAPVDGYIQLWERPVLSEQYVIGADTADGKGEALALGEEIGGVDRNHAAIYRLSDGVQVGAIHGRQHEDQFAKLLVNYAVYFNQAMLAIERNRRAVVMAALLYIRTLREAGKMVPGLYQAPRSGDVHPVLPVSPERRVEYGWLTDERTRPLLLSELREALTMRTLKPRDKVLFRELMNFGYPMDRHSGLKALKPEGLNGFHDDRVFAHGVVVQARKQARLLARNAGGVRFTAQGI